MRHTMRAPVISAGEGKQLIAPIHAVHIMHQAWSQRPSRPEEMQSFDEESQQRQRLKPLQLCPDIDQILVKLFDSRGLPPGGLVLQAWDLNDVERKCR
eukprot:1784653-Amphidinium_carterae.1